MPHSLSPEEDQLLIQLLADVKHNTEFFMGYPVSKDFNYEELTPFLQYPMNNLGDPFVPSTYAVGSRELEKEVVKFFADLFRAQSDDWWGLCYKRRLRRQSIWLVSGKRTTPQRNGILL